MRAVWSALAGSFRKPCRSQGCCQRVHQVWPKQFSSHVAADREIRRHLDQSSCRRVRGFDIAKADVAGRQIGVRDAEAGIGPDRQSGVSGRVGEGAGKEVGQGECAVGMVAQRIVERAQPQRLCACSTDRWCRSLWALTKALKPKAKAELRFNARARSSTSTAAS